LPGGCPACLGWLQRGEGGRPGPQRRPERVEHRQPPSPALAWIGFRAGGLALSCDRDIDEPLGVAMRKIVLTAALLIMAMPVAFHHWIL